MNISANLLQNHPMNVWLVGLTKDWKNLQQWPWPSSQSPWSWTHPFHLMSISSYYYFKISLCISDLLSRQNWKKNGKNHLELYQRALGHVNDLSFPLHEQICQFVSKSPQIQNVHPSYWMDKNLGIFEVAWNTLPHQGKHWFQVISKSFHLWRNTS